MLSATFSVLRFRFRCEFIILTTYVQCSKPQFYQTDHFKFAHSLAPLLSSKKYFIVCYTSPKYLSLYNVLHNSDTVDEVFWAHPS